MTPLDKLHTALCAIAPFEVAAPSQPMEVVLRDAHLLHRRLRPNAMRPHLVGMRTTSNARDELLTAVAAAREAQDRWLMLRDRDDAQLEHVRAAVALRVEIMVACLRNVAHEPAALARIEGIARGCEVTDLIEDLETLADILDQHRAAFEADEAFDASARAEAARCTASELTDRLTEPDPDKAKALRDRAYTYLTSLVSSLRAASH